MAAGGVDDMVSKAKEGVAENTHVSWQNKQRYSHVAFCCCLFSQDFCIAICLHDLTQITMCSYIDNILISYSRRGIMLCVCWLFVKSRDPVGGR
jgi:hypothetical protein